MAVQFTKGLKPIKVQILSIDGVPVTPSDSLTSIGLVEEGSTSINQEPPTETKYKSDYDDAAYHIGVQNGDFVLETDITEVTKETVARLTGASLSGNTISMPSVAPVIVAKVEIPFDTGFEKIVFHEAQVIANLTHQNVKTEMCKLHLKCVAMIDSNGNYVDIEYPDNVSIGAISTFTFTGGADYEPGDILTVTQVGGSGSAFIVNTVDVDGGIVTMSKIANGIGYAVADNLPTTSNSVAGLGATVSILSVA